MAVLQHILPPFGVVSYPHMVGDNIEQQTKTLPPQLRREFIKPFLSAKLRIKAVVACDIIAVHAAGAGFENWRGVEVADAKPLEVTHDSLRVGEVEVFVHLRPVGEIGTRASVWSTRSTQARISLEASCRWLV